MKLGLYGVFCVYEKIVSVDFLIENSCRKYKTDPSKNVKISCLITTLLEMYTIHNSKIPIFPMYVCV